jgi:hypothetical protein
VKLRIFKGHTKEPFLPHRPTSKTINGLIALGAAGACALITGVVSGLGALLCAKLIVEWMEIDKLIFLIILPAVFFLGFSVTVSSYPLFVRGIYDALNVKSDRNYLRLILGALAIGFVVYIAHGLYESRNDRLIADFALKSRDPSVCQKMAQSVRVSDCRSAILNAAKDPQDCEKFTDKIEIGSCYGLVASAKNDFRICLRIDKKKFPEIRDECLWAQSHANTNPKLCQYFIDKRTRSTCYSDIKRRKKGRSQLQESLR